MPTRLRSRLKIRRLLICLLLGALINVGVAWGFAIYPYKPTWSGHKTMTVPWPIGMPSDWPTHGQGVNTQNGLGITGIGIDFSVRDSEHQVYYHSMTCRYGLPLRAIEHSYFSHYEHEPNRSGQVIWHGVIDGPSFLHWPRLRGTRFLNGVQVPLPLQPRPIGFTINTLFYAALSYASLTGLTAFRHRRRRKKSACSKCGYDIAGLDRCPECGEAVGAGESESA